MSYYFAIIGTQDNPLFEHEFGTSKQGGDGQSRFTDQARHLNQFILHSALDVVEEVQWNNGQLYVQYSLFPHRTSHAPILSCPVPSTHLSIHAEREPPANPAPSPLRPSRYLKVIDKFFNNYISCFVTGANVKFLLLHQPFGGSSSSGSSRSSTSIAANPTSAATEEAIKAFFLEVYENWVKAVMNPFYKVNMEVKSPIFRQRVFAAGRKYL